MHSKSTIIIMSRHGREGDKQYTGWFLLPVYLLTKRLFTWAEAYCKPIQFLLVRVNDIKQPIHIPSLECEWSRTVCDFDLGDGGGGCYETLQSGVRKVRSISDQTVAIWFTTQLVVQAWLESIEAIKRVRNC